MVPAFIRGYPVRGNKSAGPFPEYVSERPSADEPAAPGPSSLPAPAAGFSQQKGTARRRRYEWSAYLYILPAFAILAVFHIFPVFYAIFISLNKGPINHFAFVGLSNYARALGGPDFWSSLVTTFVYALMTLPFTMLLGLFFAYLLYQGIRGKGFFRTVFFLPYVISTVGSSIVWAWVFDPSSGLANQVLAPLGIGPYRWLIEPTGVFQVLGAQFNWNLPAWLQGPSLALLAIAIFSVWQSLGYDIVIFLAGLTNIPGEFTKRRASTGPTWRSSSATSPCRCWRPPHFSCWSSRSSPRCNLSTRSSP